MYFKGLNQHLLPKKGIYILDRAISNNYRDSNNRNFDYLAERLKNIPLMDFSLFMAAHKSDFTLTLINASKFK